MRMLAWRMGFLVSNLSAKPRGVPSCAGLLLHSHPPVKTCERGIRTRGQRRVKPPAPATNDFVPPQESTSALPPSLAWFWNPSKKIIYGDRLFWYPIGDTPARNLFEGLGTAASSALLLGCGDVRNVLESCRQSKSAGNKLAFALNDFNSSTIARDVLLLTISDQIDASNVGDVDFLWGVWYNLRLPEEHFSRLRKVVNEILDGNGEVKPWLKIAGRDWEVVETVYRSWLVDGASLPDVDDVQELRKERMLESLNKGQPEGLGHHGWEEWIQRLQDPSLSNVRDASLRGRGTEECGVYVETGSISRDDPGDAESFLPNVTLLHPESRRWLNHYGSSPFPAYRHIVSDKNLRDAGGLVKACQRRLQEWVVALQTRTRLESPTVEVSLHCSDALEFCLCGDVSRSFDVIDSTNLADHVGLLNLVVCAGPRLRNRLGSRLCTSTSTWVFYTENLRDYVDKALSFNSKFAPTILGLRLMTNLGKGKAPDEILFGATGRDERRLEWQPMPPLSAPINVDVELIRQTIQSGKKIPRQPEPCAVGVQLARIVRTCCFLPLGKDSSEKCGLRLSSPTTLTLLLKNMDSRCVMETSGGALSGRFTEWCIKYCASFGLEAEKVARLMDPSRGGLVEVRGQLCRDRMLAAMVTITPIVRMGLVHRSLWEKSTNIELINNALAVDLEARKSPDMSLVHVIDNASVDDAINVRFLLPEDHGLAASEWEVVLIDLDRPLGITVHSYASLESMEQVAFSPPAPPVNERIERGGGADKTGTRIASFKEYGDRFVVRISYDLSMQGSKFFTKFDQANSGDPSLSMVLGFRSESDQALKIDFPSPVKPRDAKFKRRRSKQVIECVFPKSSVFPATAAGAPELTDLEGLPDHEDDTELSVKLGTMFSIQELMFKFSKDNTAVSGDPFYDLRNTIQILFVRLLKDGKRVHLFYNSQEQARAGDEPLLSLVVLSSIKRMEDGEPAILVSYVDDADVKSRMKAGRFDAQRFAVRFRSVVEEFGGKGDNVIFVGEEEVKLLRKMLAENSARVKPSRWQAKHVKDDSEWQPSFVKPMYPENIKTAQVGSKELREKVGKMSMEDALEELAKISSGGSSGEGGVETGGGTSSRDVAAAPSGNVEENRKEESVTIKCGNCGTTSGLKRCSGCGKVWYCGRDCQKENWGVHQHQCGAE